MVSLWRKYKKAAKRQKEALHSIFAGLLLFLLSYTISLFRGSLCLIKNIFDVSCPGCGLTRGFVAILKLDFKEAIRLNVLSVPLFCGIAIYATVCVTDLLLGREDLVRMSKFFGRKYMLAVYIFIFVISMLLNPIT